MSAAAPRAPGRSGPATPAATLPPDASRHPIYLGWVVLVTAAVIVAVGTGITFSLAVFLRPLEEEFGWGRALISGIALVNWIVFGVGSFTWGALSDRIGARRVVGLGAALLGLAMLVSSQVTAAWQLYAAFGILGALGASAFYVPLSATATRWFVARRGIAVSVISCGMGLGLLVVPPLARALITALGWRATFALFGVLAWVVTGIAIRFLVNRPEDRGLLPYGVAPGRFPLPRPETRPRAGTAAPSPAGPIWSDAFRQPAFWALGLVNFACCAAHSGPIFHMVAHAMDLGVPKMAAASMLGLSGATSIGGRLGSGLLADRVGPKPALVAMLALQAATISIYLLAGDAASLYLVALAFGVGYGGAMPLYALVARELFGDRVIGTAFGGIFLISALGMGLGAYGGGVLFDRLGSYWSLHLGSTLVGAAAIALAFTLRFPARLPVLAGGR